MTVDCLLFAHYARSRWIFILGVIGWLVGASHALASQSVELTWTPSASPTIVAYQVFYGTESGVYPNSITFGDVSDVIVPGLADGVTYYIAVSAIDADNFESTYSPEVVYTTPAPASIEVEAQGSTNALGAVALSWTASSDSDVYGYAIDYGTQSGDYTNSVTCYGTTNTVISGLTGGATYYFAVAPIDSLGVEAVASDEAAFTVPALVALQLQASMPADAAGVELTWNPISNEGIAGYYIYYGTQSGVYPNSVNAGDGTNYILGGLVPGQTYYCAVAPVDAYGDQGPLSNEASSPAAGPVPVQMEAQATTQAMEAVNVAWTDSSDTNVEGYAVEYWIPGSGSTNSLDFFGSTNTIITGLTPGVNYDFAIEPINSFGNEPIASGVVSCAVPAPEPITLYAQALATASVGLSWNAVPNEGVVNYNIYYGTQSGSYSYSATCGDVPHYVVGSLYGGQTFYFAVAAVDAFGTQGPLSNEASATTLAPTPAVLTSQVYSSGAGQATVIEISTPSVVSGPWELDSSSDLQNWTLYTNGYGYGEGDGYDVDVYFSIDPAVPQLFFRLSQ
ncbi:MAG: fibronectin type III domain-containing protein [Verrucomicrobiota bacterium]